MVLLLVLADDDTFYYFIYVRLPSGLTVLCWKLFFQRGMAILSLLFFFSCLWGNEDH
jgi:hypothetical protein